MTPIPELVPHLKQLRLSGILDSLDARNRQAIESKLAYTQFLAILMGDEPFFFCIQFISACDCAVV
jgi:hypothetical protein